MAQSVVKHSSPNSHSNRKGSRFSCPVDFWAMANVTPPSNKGTARPIRADLVMIFSKPIAPSEEQPTGIATGLSRESASECPNAASRRRHFNRGTPGLRRPSASVSPRRVISRGGRVDFRPLHSQAIGDNARHSDVGRICRWIYGTTWALSLVPDICQYLLRQHNP